VVIDKIGYYMYRQTQRFIGISRFIDNWATCFDPSSGHPQALKEYRSVKFSGYWLCERLC
jgi:hypothetical protein